MLKQEIALLDPAFPHVARQAAPPKHAAQDAQTTYRAFEAMMLAQMWQGAMPEQTQSGASGQAEAIFRGMLLQQHSLAMAQAGGIGLAKLMMKGLPDAGQ
jgi:Rod binding domain-containing protein